MERLSEALPGRCSAECMRCGVSDDDAGLVVWQEHDERDRPECVYIVLCKACSDAIIEPHPRLYAPMRRYAPTPGVMVQCATCIHQAGVRCLHPDLIRNGGTGLAVRTPGAGQAFVCRRGGRGGRETIYTQPPECTGYVDERKGVV